VEPTQTEQSTFALLEQLVKMLILLEHALQVSVLESTLMNAQTSTKNVLEVLASQLRALKITLQQFAPRWFVEQMALVQTVQPMTPP
jgi:uncharacterized protein YhhL (DUF1145 family)